ncbi:TetR/AcrR family transcriptional regulator [Paenibacillus sp. V4I9]|uniref:TetR/AcrR family transcriptional regulator n=1 Tax=Paenibacillus sp. V4I9 TaxID=3042308 RepID=UPI0027D8E1BC|nr:TetR/AcrR family transcriptional regulator [Paenibacillus sp. V4I9]
MLLWVLSEGNAEKLRALDYLSTSKLEYEYGNRKTQILDLSLDLICEKGYVANSYDDISKHLGVTKAIIHYHFEKKEDLAVALTDRIHQSLKSLRLSLNKDSIPVEEKIKRFIAKQLELGVMAYVQSLRFKRTMNPSGSRSSKGPRTKPV